MGIYYVEIVDNEFKELKKRFLVQKKIVNNDFEKGLHLNGGGGGIYGEDNSTHKKIRRGGIKTSYQRHKGVSFG